MSTVSTLPLSRASSPAGAAQSYLSAHLALFIEALHLWLERKWQRDALRARVEDERLLADIGLTREQVMHEANKPFWR